MVILQYKWLLLLPALLASGHLTQEPNNAAAHPLFVSVTEINHNAADKNLEISCKIFIDDFEKTLTNIYHTKRSRVNLLACDSSLCYNRLTGLGRNDSRGGRCVTSVGRYGTCHPRRAEA